MQGEPSLHGAIIYTVDGVVGQVQGVPSPPGLIAYLPKYVLCSGGSPWRGRGYSLCREIPHYGPRGLASVMRRLGARWRRDPLYGVEMPYASLYEVARLIRPREALEAFASRAPGGSRPVEALYTVVRGACVSLGDLGLTGSYAMGIFHSSSDLDLIAYDRGSQRLYDYFSGLRRGPSREYLGGVVLEPYVDISWRRARLHGISVTWTGVPRVWHCPPLESYYSIPTPNRVFRGSLRVEPGQLGALLYPPCVEAGGYWVVSFEYNVGGALYEGGRIYVEGLLGGSVVYLGAREYPGRVRLPS